MRRFAEERLLRKSTPIRSTSSTLFDGVMMMESTDTLRSQWPEQRTRASARERILRALGTAERPLRWAELTSALGSLTDEIRIECEWLMDHGYIAPLRGAGAERAGEALWTYGDRGLAWARRNGVRPRSTP
jgi:hypothetical protein